MAKFQSHSRLDIHEEAVQSYIRAGGEVNDLLWDIAKGVRTYSYEYISAGKGGNRKTNGTHVRSGRLRRGLWANKPKLEGPLQGVAQSGSSARHTIYFHDGTRAEITGKPHLMVPTKLGAKHTNTAFSGAAAQIYSAAMADAKKLGPGKKVRKGVFRPKSVRGQWAKPFLKEGLDASMAAQGLVTR